MKLRAITGIFLAFTIAVNTLFFSVTAKAANEDFIIDNGVLIAYTGAGGDITIPNTVTSIGDNVFQYNESLTSVIIPSGVIKIGDSAFSDCTNLNSITIPGSVTSIGFFAFERTPWLENYANDFVVVGNGILYKYKGTNTTATIPDTVSKIGNAAFGDCHNLTSLTIPTSVTSIGNNAFSGCTSLSDITIPTTVTTVGYYAFAGTPWLDNYTDDFVVVGDGILCVYKGTAETVTVPSTVKRIVSYSFQYSSVTSVTIPNSVISMSEYAFMQAVNLVDITIGRYVASIGFGAFYGCSSLTQITVNTNNTIYASVSGVLFNKAKTLLIQYPMGKTNTSYTIPATVINIENYAFCGNGYLTSVTIAASVKNIGESAFMGCYLTSITIPNNVEIIGAFAFSDCYDLVTAAIGSGVKSIGADAFSNCIGLTQINVNTSNTLYASVDGVLFNNAKTELIVYPVANARISYTIPASVMIIDDFAFWGCGNLTSVSVPNSVTSIGLQAFTNCSGLTQINVNSGNTAFASPDGVLFDFEITRLIQYPVGNTNTIYSIPITVTSVEDYAFYGSQNLANVIVPSTVTGIGEGAFADCPNLTIVGEQETYAEIYANDNGIPFITPGLNIINVPDKYLYVIGEDLNLSGIVLKFVDPSFVVADVNAADCVVSGYDSATAGVQTVTLTYSGSMAAFVVQVHEPYVLESAHPYADNFDYTWEYTLPETAENIDITFSTETFVEEYWDYIYIYDSSNNLVGTYTGSDLAGQTITVPGNSFKIQLTSDESNTEYGFAIVSVTAAAIEDPLTAVEGSGCIVDNDKMFIFGIEPGTTNTILESKYIQLSGAYYLRYTPDTGTLGTGTVLEVVNNSTDEVALTYTIVIFGDINGDGSIDSIDAGTAVDYENYMLEWPPPLNEIMPFAGDVNGDGKLDSMDAGVMVDAENYMLTINQITGLAG